MTYLLNLFEVFIAVLFREVGWYVNVVVDAHRPFAVLVYPKSGMFHEFEVTREATNPAATEQQTKEPHTEASSKYPTEQAWPGERSGYCCSRGDGESDPGDSGTLGEPGGGSGASAAKAVPAARPASITIH